MNHRLGKHMNGTAAIQPGPDFRQRSKANRIGRWIALIAVALFAPLALADNTLQDITYAPLSGGKVQVSGFLAWLAWAAIHLQFLAQSSLRMSVFLQWAWTYITGQRGSRLIVNHHGAELARPVAREAQAQTLSK